MMVGAPTTLPYYVQQKMELLSHQKKNCKIKRPDGSILVIKCVEQKKANYNNMQVEQK